MWRQGGGSGGKMTLQPKKLARLMRVAQQPTIRDGVLGSPSHAPPSPLTFAESDVTTYGHLKCINFENRVWIEESFLQQAAQVSLERVSRWIFEKGLRVDVLRLRRCRDDSAASGTDSDTSLFFDLDALKRLRAVMG